jgi:hypothetical protein
MSALNHRGKPPMSAPRFIDIDGKRYLWRDIVKLRQEQCRASAAGATTLFALHEDFQPANERTRRRRSGRA